jgi:LysM repeat protein
MTSITFKRALGAVATAGAVVAIPLAMSTGTTAGNYEAAAAPVTAEASVESAPAASTGSGNYVVKAGDTLSKIAAAHGISLENLASQVPNINLIFPGQSLSV